ncbi:hypothetical protein ACFYQA_22690 [Streptomyces sp. NPDC005774]|uniref:hypothetical protein n=1 Tax=Streptomyces sp. NPDC005774 TaxID=3364728 RepID=UPI00368CBDEE
MFENLFLAPVVLFTCECGDVFAGYENGDVIKLHDAEYGDLGGLSLGPILYMYREDPDCTGCGGDLVFTALV